MKKLFFAASLMMLVCMTACNFSTTIIVTPGMPRVSAAGGTITLTVTTDNHWKAECDSAWVQIEPTEGFGNAEVALKVSANPYAASQSTIIRFRDTDENNLVQVIVTREAGTSNSGDKPQQNPNAPIKVDKTEINAPASGGSYTVNIVADASMKWQVSASASWVSYTPGVGKGNASISITVAAADKFNYDKNNAQLMLQPFGSSDKNEITYVYITRDGNPAPTFTIDGGKKVMFAPGNLQYCPQWKTWRFADYQYTILGEQNKGISPTYYDYIDLFGFGTSGYNDCFPYLYEADAQYGPNNDDDIEGTDYDWGIYNSSKIENSPNKNYKWFTLSSMDWNEIIDNNVMTLATWKGVKGLLIFPDGYKASGEETFKNYTDWQIDTDSWVKEVGALFLPAAGVRLNKTYISMENEENMYWTSSSHTATGAGLLYFTPSTKEDPDGDVSTIGYSTDIRSYGYPVRLARLVE